MTQPPGWGAPEPGRDAPGPGQPGPPHPPVPPPSQAGHNGWGQPSYGQPGWDQHPSWAPQAPTPRPGIVPLRPLGLGEIYDGAFQAIRSNPRTMLGVSALVIAVTTLITTVPQAAALTNFGSSGLLDPARASSLSTADVAASVSGLVSSLVIPALLELLAVTIVTGLLIIAVSGAVLGRRTPPGELWARTRRRIPGLVVLGVILPLSVIVLGAVLIAPGLIAVVAGATVAGVLLILLGGVAAILVFVALGYGLWALAAPAMLLEGLSVLGALRRSARLARSSFWRVLGIMLLTAVLVQILSGLVSLPFTLVGTVIGFSQSAPYQNFGLTVLQLVVTNIGTIIAGAVLYPFSAAVTALLYIDLRIRREGLDVELIRAAGGPL